MMKKYYLLFVLSIALTGFVNAQNISGKRIDVVKPKPSNVIDGSEYLRDTYNKLAEMHAMNPSFGQKFLGKTEAWNFSVGTAKEWWGEDKDDNFYKVQSTCRAVGTNCYIFVEDSMWNNRVNQSAVDAFVTAFDSQTPANENKGIYQTVTETYGNPPDKDGDFRIIILVLNIDDGYVPGGSYIAGYFHPVDQYSQADLDNYYPGQGYKSNEAEIFYIDCNPADLLGYGLSKAQSTIAHEFQHMVHYNYPKDGVNTFLNEGLSMMSEYICGYPFREQLSYACETNQYLFRWRGGTDDVLTDYSRASRFMFYMYDQFGIEVLKEFCQNENIEMAAVTDVVGKHSSQNYWTILENWQTANIVDDITVDNKWGYKECDMPVVCSETYSTGTVSVKDIVLWQGAKYYTFKDLKNFLKVTFNNTTSKLKIKAIKKGIGATQVVDVALNQENIFTDLGTNNNEITFAVYNLNEVAAGVNWETKTDIGEEINITASGEESESIFELKHDISKAIGSYDLLDGDKILVTYDAVPGFILDSVKIACRNTGTINFDIHEFTGTGDLLVLEQKYASYSVVSSKDAQKVDNSFQDPFDNWVKISTKQENITTNKSFCAQIFVTASSPGIMLSPRSGNTAMNNYMYINSRDKWYIPGNGEGTIYVFMVRAYVSLPSQTGTREVIELIPATYTLEQNCPNPFNPETVVEYSIPKASQVNISIYNILGERVAEIVNEFKTSGSYRAKWNGKNTFGQRAASGVYFYRIQAGDFVQTKKMNLLK